VCTRVSARNARIALGVALASIMLAGSGCGARVHSAATPPVAAPATEPSKLDGHVVAPYPAPEFGLKSQTGAKVKLAGQRGRVVLVTFLYTHCPDVCPLIASQLNTALRLLPAVTRTHVRVLAVSVDPEGDSPASVRRFIREHSLLPQFLYLTGSRPELQPVWQAYNVLATPRSGSAIDHSSYIALVDRPGRVRAYFDSTSRPAAIARDVRLLLRS
jgi:protein SCO1